VTEDRGSYSVTLLRLFHKIASWPVASIVVALLVATPVLAVLVTAAGDADGEWQHLVETRLGSYAWQTLQLVLMAGGIALVTGTTTAWLIATCDFPGRRIARWMLLLPLAVPAYLAAYAYADWLQFAGPVQTRLREWTGWGRRDYWFPEVRGLGGAAMVLGFALYPYVYLAARAAFVEQAHAALEVGRSLGRGPWRCFFGVALPLARPALAGGTALVVMETLADFGVADHMAVDTFATGVYRAWRSLESPATAARLAAVLLGAVALLILSERLLRRGATHHVRSRRLPPTRQPLGRVAGILAAVVCFVPILFGFALPTGLFLHLAVTVGDERALEVVSQHGRTTLFLAAVACVLATMLSVLVAYGRRLGGRATKLIGRGAGFGYAVPGTVIAVGLLTPLGFLDHRLNDVTRSLFDWTPGLVLSGSIVAVLLGYQVRFLGVSLAMVEGGLARIRRSVDEAARSLGSGGFGLLFRVHLPMLRGSLLAAALLVFVDVAKELPATLMLRPFNLETLAVRTYQLAADERLEEASFAALAIIGVGLVPVAVLARLLDRPLPKGADE
jgi:iron(III) transport system permease protein